MKLLVVNDCKDEISEDFLQKWVQQISTDLVKKNILKPEMTARELSVVLLEERDAKKINWQFRTKDYAADVLSFSTDDPEAFGELVICPTVIKKQAVEHKLKYEQEMAYMILHGVLHLLGFDHEKGPEEEKKMFSIQDEIFEKHMLKKEKKSTKSSSSAKAKSAGATVKAKSSSSAKSKSVDASGKNKLSKSAPHALLASKAQPAKSAKAATTKTPKKEKAAPMAAKKATKKK